MTGTAPAKRGLLIVGASCWVLAASLAVAALLGSRAAAWTAAGCLALALGLMLSTIKVAAATVIREPFRRQELPHKRYPRFEAILGELGWAVQDRRYFDRVLAPLLRDIAADLTGSIDAQRSLALLRAALGETLWPLLDPDRGPATGAPGEPAAPSVAQLAALVDRLEHLERSWI